MGSDTMSSSSVSVAQELAVRSFEVQSAEPITVKLRTFENDGSSLLPTSKKDIRRVIGVSL